MLKKNTKQKKKELDNIKAKDYKLMSVGRAMSLFRKKKNLKPNKEKKIQELNEKISNLEKMDIVDYLRYSKIEYLWKKKKRRN